MKRVKLPPKPNAPDRAPRKQVRPGLDGKPARRMVLKGKVTPPAEDEEEGSFLMPYQGRVTKDMCIRCLLMEAEHGDSLGRMYASLLIGAMLSEDEELRRRWHFLAADFPLPSHLKEQERTAATQQKQEVAALLLERYRHILREKEVDFLIAVSNWPRELSERQLKWIDDIVQRANKARLKGSRT
jgi:hypothetical protein